jgi:hypothetical protein
VRIDKRTFFGSFNQGHGKSKGWMGKKKSRKALPLMWTNQKKKAAGIILPAAYQLMK